MLINSKLGKQKAVCACLEQLHRTPLPSGVYPCKTSKKKGTFQPSNVLHTLPRARVAREQEFHLLELMLLEDALEVEGLCPWVLSGHLRPRAQCTVSQQCSVTAQHTGMDALRWTQPCWLSPSRQLAVQQPWQPDLGRQKRQGTANHSHNMD